MASPRARPARFRPLVPLVGSVLGLAAACGPGFTPNDGDGSGGAGSGGVFQDGSSSGGADPDSGGENAGGMATDAPEVTGGRTSSGGTNAGGASSGGASSASGGQAGSGDGHDCNPDHILCLPLVAPEPCPAGETYSVEGSCYGSCVPVGECACESHADCPDPSGTDEYACHGTTDRCGPWL